MHRSHEPRVHTSSPGAFAQGEQRRDFCLIPTCDGLTEWLAPMCDEHMIEAWRWVEARPALWPPHAEMRRQREREEAEAAARAAERAARNEAARAKLAPVVYYIRRRNGHIKIGTSTQLGGRLNGLRATWDDVLAVEWGGRDVEAERHAQFATDRRYNGSSSSEEFAPSAALLAHIETVRQTNGEPQAVWHEQAARNRAAYSTAAV